MSLPADLPLSPILLEPGQVIGIYYSLPTIGPALSPVIGGALTETPQGWRSTFYFIAASKYFRYAKSIRRALTVPSMTSSVFSCSWFHRPGRVLFNFR